MSKIILTERKLINAIAGQAYDQCPDRKPRNIDVVMNKAKEFIRKDFEVMSGDWYYKNMDTSEVYKYVHDLLFDIPEFIDWNLSQAEKDKNVFVDDENRQKYSFSTAYDVHTKDSWYTDFVDLDAFVNNVCRNIDAYEDYSKDCFRCIWDSDENKAACIGCSRNPDVEDKFKSHTSKKGANT